jgi:putative membrane protein
MLRLALATLHLLALGIGLGAIWARARALTERPFERAAARRAFTADNWWGLAAGLWIATGLWRLFAATEKATDYYMHDDMFRLKMTMFLGLFILELWPMITLMRWRRTVRRAGGAWSPPGEVAGQLGLVSYVEVIVTVAVAMARGYGYSGVR